MEKIIKENQEKKVITLLNEIALLEFKTNYNTSETGRILDVNKLSENGQYQFYVSELKKMLPEIDGVRYNIADIGRLDIWVRKEDGIEGEYRYLQEFAHTIELPYGYVMGSKIGKRAMESIAKDLERSFERYKVEV